MLLEDPFEMVCKTLEEFVYADTDMSDFNVFRASYEQVQVKLGSKLKEWLIMRPSSQTIKSKQEEWLKLFDQATDHVLITGAAVIENIDMKKDHAKFSKVFFNLMQVKKLKKDMPWGFKKAIWLLAVKKR